MSDNSGRHLPRVLRGAGRTAGRALLAAGVVVLLFTAFGLWGTGIFEAHSQSVLRGELAKTLPPGTTERAGRIAAQTGGDAIFDPGRIRAVRAADGPTVAVHRSSDLRSG